MKKLSAAGLVGAALNVASGLVALGFVLTLLVMGIMLAVPRFSPVPVEWEVNASWLGIGTSMTIPVAFSIEPEAHRIEAPAIGVDRAEILNAHGQLRFPSTNGPFLFGNAVLLMVLFAAVSWILHELRAVFRTLRDNRPFVPANALRLRRIGFSIIAAEIMSSAIVYFENRYAVTHFAASGLRFEASPHLDFVVIVLGLIVLAIAEVFAAGTRLDEDQTLTI